MIERHHPVSKFGLAAENGCTWDVEFVGCPKDSRHYDEEGVKKYFVVATVFGSACLLATTISAQQSLLGKSCIGTFDTRKASDGEYDLGAVRINFASTMPLKATTEVACPCSKVQQAMGSVCRRSVRQTLLDDSTKALTAPAT
jgi:hypothetical protein